VEGGFLSGLNSPSISARAVADGSTAPRCA
jgi:hypothetical protein